MADLNPTRLCVCVTVDPNDFTLCASYRWTAGAHVPPRHSHALITCISPTPPQYRPCQLCLGFYTAVFELHWRAVWRVGRSSASHSTMWLCLASRWKMVSLITNHVIMWKPHQPHRTNESLLDKINDSFWAVHWWPWLSTGAQGGQACMFGYNKEEMSNFALDTNETWERQSGRPPD